MHNPNKSDRDLPHPSLHAPRPHASFWGSSVDNKVPGKHSVEPTSTDDI